MNVNKGYALDKNKIKAFEKACEANGIQLNGKQQRKSPIQIIDQRGRIVEVNDAGEAFGIQKSWQDHLYRGKKPKGMQERKRTAPISPLSKEEEGWIVLGEGIIGRPGPKVSIVRRKKPKNAAVNKKRKKRFEN